MERLAAAALAAERQNRSEKCLAAITGALKDFGCGLQVVTQELQMAGEAAVSRIAQVNVVPLNQPEPPAAPDSAPPAKEGGAA